MIYANNENVVHIQYTLADCLFECGLKRQKYAKLYENSFLMQQDNIQS